MTQGSKVGVPIRDAEIIARCGFKNEIQQDVANDMGLSRRTVSRVINSETARQMLMGALEKHGLDIDTVAKKHIQLLDAERYRIVDGEQIIVQDNNVQLGVLREINSIYGNYAPKEFDIRGSVAQAPLDELAEQLDASVERLSLDGPAGESGPPAGNDSPE